MSTSAINPLSSMTDALASSSSGSGTTSTSSSGTSTTTGTGLGQGINVQQFVQYAVANQQATITNLQSQEATLATQTSELSTIGSDFTNLQNAVNALSDPLGALAAQAATTSDSGVVSGTAGSSAAAGTHSIIVSALATTSSAYSDEIPASNTALTGSLTISVGGATGVSVPIDASDNTTTLTGLVSYINSHPNLGVTASVVQDANGTRLALVSNTSGLPGNLNVTGTLNYTDSSGNTHTANFNPGISGSDARLWVDGIPVQSASNTVSNIIPGVTLTLNGTSAGANPSNTTTPTGTPTTLSVSPDTSQITNAITSFVNAYNAVTTEINNQFNVTSTSSGGPLENDDTLRQVQSMLLNAVSYSMTGNNGIVNLASMGINMNDDGTLTVDNNALSAALSTNASAVQNFFQNASSGFAQQLNNAIQTINAPATGLLSLDSQGFQSTATDLNQQITDLQAALTVQEQNFTALYSQVNTTLQELPMLENQLTQQLAGIA